MSQFDNQFPEEFGDDTQINPLMLPWHQRLLMRFFPKLFLKMHMAKQDIDTDKLDLAYKLFGDARRIDIQPLSGTGGRGFIICLDSKFTLWFYQDGDHFTFDGIEMGEYDNGDVTVFDGLRSEQTFLP